MQRRQFLTNILSLVPLSQLEVFTPKCPNCGAPAGGDSCRYCKSPISIVNPSNVAVFNTASVDVKGVEIHEACVELSRQVSVFLSDLGVRYVEVSTFWMPEGKHLGRFRVEVLKKLKQDSYDAYGWYSAWGNPLQS